MAVGAAPLERHVFFCVDCRRKAELLGPWFPNVFFEPGPDLFRLEAPWTGGSGVGDLAITTDDVESFRPRGIGDVNAVVHVVDNTGHGQAQCCGALLSDFAPCEYIHWLGEHNAFVDIGIHLPFIARVCFLDVDEEESHAIAVLIVQLFQGVSLTPERRSCPASEDQHDWSCRLKLGQRDHFTAVERRQCEIRS